MAYAVGKDKWCSGCETTKDVDQFAKNASAKDGLNTYCRECSARIQRQAKNGGQAVDPRALVIENGRKLCPTCGETKQIAAFIPNKHAANGYNLACRSCNNDKRKANAAEKAARGYAPRRRSVHAAPRAPREPANAGNAPSAPEGEAQLSGDAVTAAPAAQPSGARPPKSWPNVAAFDEITEQGEISAAEIKRREKAVKAAADAKRRHASDFEALKPEDMDASDFDTSVANDPKSWAASKQAAMEKRQEFSLAMGGHMENLRRAAVAEATGYASLLDSMPVEDGKYIASLSEQERRFGNRRMARSLSLYAAGEELSRRLFAAACQQYMTDRVEPTGYAAKPPPDKPRKRSVCLLLSDLHIGADLSGRDNPEEFCEIQEARRLEYVMRQAIDYKPQYRDDSELVVMINGDVIEGLLLHDFRDGAPLTEQKIAFLRYFERMIGEFARAYPRVRVYCQPGNHGRDKVRHPGRATSSKWDGHETMLYYALYRACSGLPNVRFDITFRAVSAIDLHGSWFGLSHGDTEVKLGDPDVKARENLAALDKINASKIHGVEFAAWGFGHFHKPRYLPAHPRILFNGALIPPNGHARGAGYIGESCGQWLWESVEGYPIGDVRFIEVGHAQDNDERLGTIIRPFRFGLHPDSDMTFSGATEAERDYREGSSGGPRSSDHE